MARCRERRPGDEPVGSAGDEPGGSGQRVLWIGAGPAGPARRDAGPDGAACIAQRIDERLGFPVAFATTAPDVAEILTEPVLAALIDLDGSDDATADAFVSQLSAAAVPTLALASRWDAALRERLQSRGIVDYFLKDQGLEDVRVMLRRLQHNPSTKVLVVDDSRLFRRALSKLLAAHRFNVLEAADGHDGWRVLQAEPELRLLLTDYEMPGLDGIELVQRVRALRGRDELAIIGLSTVGGTLTPRFLKHGADDFLAKPFEREEFYCRVYRSLETVEHIQAIQRAAFTDPLTRLANRLFFFQRVPALHREALASRSPLTVAMIDIDHFKVVNDTYGHAAGDAALCGMARLLERELHDFDVVARFGGEEFCAVAAALAPEQSLARLEALRRAVEQSHVDFEGRQLRFTVSVGAHCELAPELDVMINDADKLLYRAKEGGRNRLVTV